MKRPLFAIGLSWFFSTWLAFFCGDNALQISFAALLTALIFFILRQRFKYAYAACLITLAASIAFASFWIYEKRKIEPLLALAGKTAAVEGLITEAELGIRAMTYTVSASFTEYPDVPETTLIVRDFSGIERSTGDTVRFNVELSAAPESLWYKSRGILLIGQSPQDTESIPAGEFRLERALMRLRVIFTRNVYANLTEENADIVTAMVLGMKNNVDPGIYSALGKSGTAHLLTVSGMHLSILFGIVLFALKKIRCPRRLSAIIAILFGFLFSLLVGFSASVFRAFIMMSITLLAGRVFPRRSDSLSSLGLALLICGIVWPHWVLGWGVWFSAGSTLGIILYASRISEFLREYLLQRTRLAKRPASLLSETLGISVSACVFSLPLSFLMCGWISLISPFTNLLIAPFVPVTTVCGALCAFLPPTVPLMGIVAKITDVSTIFIVRVSEILGGLPFSTFAMDESWIFILFTGICAVLEVLMIFRADKRLIVYAAALIAVCGCVGDMSLAAANRGNIELVTLEDKNPAILFRGGEAVILGTPDAYEISGLLRYLAFRGVKNIPAVIATDSPDNVGSGLLRLSQEYDIDCVVAPNDVYIEDALTRALPESLVYSGGYAEITALGGAVITPDLKGKEIHIRIGENEIVKIRREYGIMEPDGSIRIFDDGKMLLPRNTVALFEPAGAFLFGESRIALKE